MYIPASVGARKAAAGAFGNDSNTLLLVQSETTNGSTTFTDASSSAKTVNSTGTVDHSTDQAKFGSSAMHFQSGALTVSSADFTVGTGDFTYDWWIYSTGVGTTGMMAATTSSGTVGPLVYSAGAYTYGFKMGNGGSGSVVDTFTIPSATWTHIALVRSSGLCGVAVNGVFTQALVSNTLNVTGNACAIGARYSDGSFPMTNSFIEEFRFSNVARWTADFTPPDTPYGGAAPPDPDPDPDPDPGNTGDPLLLSISGPTINTTDSDECTITAAGWPASGNVSSQTLPEQWSMLIKRTAAGGFGGTDPYGFYGMRISTESYADIYVCEGANWTAGDQPQGETWCLLQFDQSSGVLQCKKWWGSSIPDDSTAANNTVALPSTDDATLYLLPYNFAGQIKFAHGLYDWPGGDPF